MCVTLIGYFYLYDSKHSAKFLIRVTPMFSHLIIAPYFLLLFSTVKTFVSVQIHRNTVYFPLSSCAFIRNVSFSQDPSIQSCIWKCVHTSDCQTGVYYDDLNICQMFSESCDINRVQPSGSIRANVICYRKNNSKSISSRFE